MKNETARREIEALDYYLQNHTSDYSEESHMAMMMASEALEITSCIKEKCAYCPHCENCDVDDETLEIKVLEQQPRDCKTCNHSSNRNCAYTEECHECMWESKYEQQPCEDVLDKIKAEIIEKFDNCSICEWFENYDYDENDISEYISVGHISDIIDIIDKYKAESEE